jgi:hypothetical protein
MIKFYFLKNKFNKRIDIDNDFLSDAAKDISLLKNVIEIKNDFKRS